MEVFIAILWYLQIICLNTDYTATQLDKMIFDNQPAIEEVQSDEQLMNQVMDSFYQETGQFTTKDVIEVWEEEPDPIPD